LEKGGFVPSSGAILITSRGTLGQCYIVGQKDRFYFQDGMITWISPKNSYTNPIFVKSVFAINSFADSLTQSANSSTVAYISISQLSKKKLICPPLPLQQQFASKIEAIEQQKELIKQSITEVETLFNSRMDYYFN
jgi:type I restriction enzyme S subunit